jgi:hypothetical protein
VENNRQQVAVHSNVVLSPFNQWEGKRARRPGVSRTAIYQKGENKIARI